MNIQLLSDLHLESAPAFRAEPAPGAGSDPKMLRTTARNWNTVCRLHELTHAAT